MRFYTTTHKHYCGIDLHAKNMYVCLLSQEGKVLLHRNLRTYLKKIENKHGKRKALSILAHRLGRTVLHASKKRTFSMEAFLKA
jgi:hypothetical protein